MLLTHFLLAALLAQADVSAPEERVRVEYVLVEVVARDGRKRLVTDLTLDEFVLREDGKKIVLESLDILDLRGAEAIAAEPPTAASLAPGVPRIQTAETILAVDFEFATYGETLEALRQLDRYFDETEAIAGLAYMVYSLEGGTLMTDFSEDPDVVLEALSEYRESYKKRERDPGRMSRPGRDDISALEKRFDHCVKATQTQVDGWNCIQGELDAFLEGQNARTLTVIRELEDLARAFPDPRSVKSIAFISPGFSVTPGVAALQLAQKYQSRVEMQGRMPGQTVDWSGQAAMTRIAPPSDLVSFAGPFLGVLAACAEYHVIFHTFDIFHFGMETARHTDASFTGSAGASEGIYRSYRQELDAGMEALADGTGGTFHGGPSLKHMRPVVEGDRFLYVLGYRSPMERQDAFRKIKVKCKRKGVKLRHRTGYYG